MQSLGKLLIMFGVTLALLGVGLWLFGRAGGGFLPGDIVIERKHVRFYFPIMTCLIVSAALSLVAWWLRR